MNGSLMVTRSIAGCGSALLIAALLLTTVLGDAQAMRGSADATPARLELSGLDGTVHVVCGLGRAIDSFCGMDVAVQPLLETTVLAERALVRAMSGWGDWIVVSHLRNPDDEGGGFGVGRLSEWREGRLQEIEGLDDAFDAYRPAVSRDGRLAFLRVESRVPYRTTLRVWDRETHESVVLAEFESPDRLRGIAWSPGGKLAYVHAYRPDDSVEAVLYRGERDRIVILDEELRYERELSVPLAGTIRWGRHLAVHTQSVLRTPVPGNLRLLDPDTGESWSLPGWELVSWSPDDSKLLLRSTSPSGERSRRLFGVAHGPGFRTVVPYGLSTEVMRSITGVWVSQEAS